jgi:hypothetical protein
MLKFPLKENYIDLQAVLVCGVELNKRKFEAKVYVSFFLHYVFFFAN